MKINLNKKITRILTITGYVAIAGVVLVLMSFANHRSTKVLCEGVVINIEDESISPGMRSNSTRRLVPHAL